MAEDIDDTEFSSACSVCDEPLTKARVHYGAVTCYSCRAFFRRATQRNEERVCKNQGRCAVYRKNRKDCTFCRYEKCLAAGMSTQLILTEEEKHRIFKKYREKKPSSSRGGEERLSDPMKDRSSPESQRTQSPPRYRSSRPVWPPSAEELRDLEEFRRFQKRQELEHSTFAAEHYAAKMRRLDSLFPSCRLPLPSFGLRPDLHMMTGSDYSGKRAVPHLCCQPHICPCAAAVASTDGAPHCSTAVGGCSTAAAAAHRGCCVPAAAVGRATAGISCLGYHNHPAAAVVPSSLTDILANATDPDDPTPPSSFDQLFSFLPTTLRDVPPPPAEAVPPAMTEDGAKARFLPEDLIAPTRYEAGVLSGGADFVGPSNTSMQQQTVKTTAHQGLQGIPSMSLQGQLRRGMPRDSPDPMMEILQEGDREDKERWLRHRRKMEIIDEQYDYENVLRFWNYNHKKFRNNLGRPDNLPIFCQTLTTTTAVATLARSDALAAIAEGTHEKLQMEGAPGRQSVIMISKRKCGVDVATVSTPPAQPPALSPMPKDNQCEGKGSALDVDLDGVKKEEEEEEEESMLETEMESLENLEQIFQDDKSLMVFASSLNIAEVEQIFTQEEGKCVMALSKEFWDIWLSMDLGASCTSGLISWIRDGGAFDMNLFLIANRQMRNRLIVASFIYDSDVKVCAQDHINLMSHNLKYAACLFHVFTYCLNDPVVSDEYRFSRNDLIQLRSAKVRSVTCQDIIDAVPLDSESKAGLQGLYRRFNLTFLGDPRVYYIMVAIVLFNPAGVELQDRESVEKLRNQYIRMLERYLSSQDIKLREGSLKVVFDLISSLPTFVEYQFYHNR